MACPFFVSEWAMAIKRKKGQAMTTADFTGKIVLVTGAASGIGLATVQKFLAQGAEVVAVDLPEVDLQEIFADHDNIICLELDITTEDAADVMIDCARQQFGGLDILVNNAGICIGQTFEETSDETWDRIMAVNVTAIFKITRRAVPLMKERGAGRIINIGSIMSDMAGPGLCAYGTSKHAVAGLTKSMAVDLGRYNITANYIQPGAIITGLSEDFLKDPEFRAYWEKKAPIGRLGEASDVADAIIFLASDAGGFISGAGLNVDGGAIINF